MAIEPLRLPEDPRWLAFCREYSGSVGRFAREVEGIDLSRQQAELFASVSAPRSRTSVVSGHGVGKTAGIASIVLWHLLCYPMSVTLLTANDIDQLKATAWKEIGLAVERIRRGPHGWIAEHIEVLADASCRILGFEDTWFVESKTANEKTANKMSGRHGEWLLIIADEASTIPDNVLMTLRGALTEQNNRMLMCSQGTRNAGFFYRTHHDLSAAHGGGDWTSLSFSSFDSPFTSDDSLRELWNTYDDDERAVRLLGQFSQDTASIMMNRKVAESMYQRGRIIRADEPYGWLILGDVASGEGLRDKSACVKARVIGYRDIGEDARRVEVVEIPILSNRIRSNLFAGALAEHGADLSNVTYVVDAGGLGINVCQDLEDAGKVVHRVNWGNPCWKGINQERYLNLRAQAMHQAARAAKEGRLSVLTSDYKNVMLDQSARIPKTYSGAKSRITVPPKGSKEWDGLGSPDLWDAIAFAFIENVSYMLSEAATGGSAAGGLGRSVRERADDLFADVA